MPDLIAHRPPNEGIDKVGNLLYEDRIKQLTIPKNIPNTIHLIWFGSWPPKADNSQAYLDNIKSWKVLNPNYSVKLWTSSASQTTDEHHKMQGFCAKNGITLQDINENKSDRYTHVKEWLASTKLGRPRFAAASDVLRLIVLEDEGGHYFDTDIKPLRPLCDDWTCANGSYQLYNIRALQSGDEKPNFEYCVMGSVPHDRLYRIANLVYARVHKRYMEKLRTLQDDSLVDKVGCIMRATGLHLSMAAQTFKLTPQIEKRGDDRVDLHGEVVEGNLQGKIQVNFDRSYGSEQREDSHTEDTRNIISYFHKITSQAYSEERDSSPNDSFLLTCLQLGLECTEMGDAGAIRIAQALKTNRSLRWLVIQNNAITDIGAQALVDALLENEDLPLEDFDIAGSDQISPTLLMELASVILRKQSIVAFQGWNNMPDLKSALQALMEARSSGDKIDLAERGLSLAINEGYIQRIGSRLNDKNKIIFQNMLVDMDLEDGVIPLLRDMHAFALEPTNRTYQNRYNAQINAALADPSLTRQCLGNGLIALGVAILVAAGITFAVASACIAAPMAIVGVAALGCGFFVKRKQETQASADLSALQHAITG